MEVILFDVTLAEHRQGLSQGLRGHHTLQLGLLQVLLLLTDHIGHLLLQRGVVRVLNFTFLNFVVVPIVES